MYCFLSFCTTYLHVCSYIDVIALPHPRLDGDQLVEHHAEDFEQLPANNFVDGKYNPEQLLINLNSYHLLHVLILYANKDMPSYFILVIFLLGCIWVRYSRCCLRQLMLHIN